MCLLSPFNDCFCGRSRGVSGETGFKQVLKSKGGSKTITYILQMNKEGEINIPACKASFLDLDKYSGEVYSGTNTVYVGVPMTLEGSSSEPEGSTASDQQKNEPSSQANTGGMEEDYGDTPGFGIFLAVTGLLMGAGFMRKKIV